MFQPISISGPYWRVSIRVDSLCSQSRRLSSYQNGPSNLCKSMRMKFEMRQDKFPRPDEEFYCKLNSIIECFKNEALLLSVIINN